MKPLDNRWTCGTVSLAFPPPDPAMLGRVGVTFQRAIFDPRVGAETYLLILDESRYAAELGTLDSLDVILRPFLVRTSAGLLAVLIWRIGTRGRQIALFEQLINPFGSLEFLTTAAEQMEIKVVVGDNQTGDVKGFFPIPNDYELQDFVAGVRSAISGEPKCDFAQAQHAFLQEFSLQELLDAEA